MPKPIATLLVAILGAVSFFCPSLAAEEPGQRFEIRAEGLPEPFASRSASNPSRIVPRPRNATLQLPPGFTSGLFAQGLRHARWLAVAPNGDVFLAEPGPGQITLLRDADGDGRAETVAPFAAGFERPHGLAFQGGYLYVADVRRVWRIKWTAGDTRASAPAEPVTADGAIGSGLGHYTRNIAFAPGGDRFYVSIGSFANIGEEAPPRATVQEFRTDGSGQATFTTGLRNPVGIAVYPGTDDVYVVVNERDGLGDGLVPDYLTRIGHGDFFGWPYSYSGSKPQPNLADRRPDLVRAAKTPDVMFQAHSAPLGLAFYDGTQFPAAYRGDAFVALHGSWNSGQPTGYKIVRVPFRDRRPAGHYENFAVGFRLPDSNPAEVWGRPVGLAVARDGSLLVADDVGQVVWRIAYRGPPAR